MVTEEDHRLYLSIQECTNTRRLVACKIKCFAVASKYRRPRRRWEDNIKMDLQEVGGGRGDWMELAEDRDRWRAIVGTVRDFRVP